MKVQEIMTVQPRTCSPQTTLAATAAMLLDGDCGMLPVVDQDRLIGVVTDRDMFIALATRNARASDLRVGEVVQVPAYTCRPDDDIQTALDSMARHSVRRLPVEATNGRLVGVVSLRDLVLASGARKPVRESEIVSTLQAISHDSTAHASI
jgi:CBS domain-containing protein